MIYPICRSSRVYKDYKTMRGTYLYGCLGRNEFFERVEHGEAEAGAFFMLMMLMAFIAMLIAVVVSSVK